MLLMRRNVLNKEPFSHRSMALGLFASRSKLQPIEERLYLTNFFGARNLTALQAEKITHVLVCAHELPSAHPQAGWAVLTS